MRNITFTEQEVVDMIVSLGESLNTDSASSMVIIQDVIEELRRRLDVPAKE